ncbi:MAG TPA: aldo/keto reductase, partial [bacterium]|nr:aldo/keto reductase [bacterium]
PASVLDHRFLRQGIPVVARARGTALFARSVFLQGLLLQPEGDMLSEHAAVVPVRRALQDLAAQGGMSLAELAVRYLLSLPGITCLVVGVETEAQLRENAALFRKGPLPGDLAARVPELVPDLPDSILYPGSWSKKMPAPDLVTGTP